MKKLLCLLVVGVLMLSLFAACGNNAETKIEGTEKPTGNAQKQEAQKENKEEQDSSWIPEKEIEFVVPSSAGGGSDLNARTIADIAVSNEFSPESFMVVNKPGGSGAVSYSYVYGKEGDSNTLMVLHNGQVMAAIVNDSPVKADMLTYVSTVAYDNLTLGVKKDSKFKDIESLIEEGSKNPETIKIGGSQRGNGDHLSFELLNKYTDAKFTYVQFNGSGEVMSALLGGHVDVGIFNPSESQGQVKSGDVVPIATFAEERISGLFKDAPTFTELGYPDLVVNEIRAIAGPPNMPAEAISFYEDMIEKVTQTEEWKKNYIEKNYLTPVFLNSDESTKLFNKESKVYEEVFTEIGLIKK